MNLHDDLKALSDEELAEMVKANKVDHVLGKNKMGELRLKYPDFDLFTLIDVIMSEAARRFAKGVKK